MIIFPQYLGGSNIFGLTALCRQLIQHPGIEIECNASNVKFIDPLGLCMLAVTCYNLNREGRRILIHNLSEEIYSYLYRMDLFEDCDIDIVGIDTTALARLDRRDSLVEVKRIEGSAQIEGTSTHIANAIVGVIPGIDFNAEPDEMTGYKPCELLTIPIQYIFAELLENALTHGRQNGFNNSCVWVSAQYYPAKDLIRLSVVDNGCGYLASLGRHAELSDKTHIAAINLALKPNVSCNRDLGIMGDSINQGIGLTVVRDLAIAAEGEIAIGSGDCFTHKKRGSSGAGPASDWQGAFINIEIPRESVKNIKIHDIIKIYQPPGADYGIRFE